MVKNRNLVYWETRIAELKIDKENYNKELLVVASRIAQNSLAYLNVLSRYYEESISSKSSKQNSASDTSSVRRRRSGFRADLLEYYGFVDGTHTCCRSLSYFSI